MISPNALWQISTGEITIHPYKERILDLVQNERTTFFTNCIIFDERIGLNLKNNSKSAIDLSIDSGTKETWNKVKNINKFDQVIDNIYKYRSYASSGKQIKLKYIILPSINDNMDDFILLVKYMEELGISHLFISRDVNKMYNSNINEKEKLLRSAAKLVSLCRKRDLQYTLSTYTPAEIKLINNLVD